jgi:hypothetical protein
MDALDRQVNVVEELVVILDGHAGGEEDHHLLLSVLLQEGEQQQKTLLRRADNVTLQKISLNQIFYSWSQITILFWMRFNINILITSKVFRRQKSEICCMSFGTKSFIDSEKRELKKRAPQLHLFSTSRKYNVPKNLKYSLTRDFQ